MSVVVATKHFEETGWWEYACQLDNNRTAQFYYHGVTRQKSWQLPPCLVSDWWEIFAPQHLRSFYFHLASGRVSWQPPPDTDAVLRGVVQLPPPASLNSPKSPHSPTAPPPQTLPPPLRPLPAGALSPPVPPIVRPLPPVSPPPSSSPSPPIDGVVSPRQRAATDTISLSTRPAHELPTRAREPSAANAQLSPRSLHQSFGPTNIADLMAVKPAPLPPPLPTAAAPLPPPIAPPPPSPALPLSSAASRSSSLDLQKKRPQSCLVAPTPLKERKELAVDFELVLSSPPSASSSPPLVLKATSASSAAAASSKKGRDKKKGSGLFGWSSKRSDKKPKPKDFSHGALLKEIHQFQFEAYAEKHFDMHRAGLFKRTLSHAALLTFTSEPLHGPFLKYSSSSLAREAVNCFNRLLLYSGVAAPSTTSPGTGTTTGTASSETTAASMQYLIWMGLQNAELRDELYLHIAKQLTGNTRPSSLPLLWKLLALYTQHFPPTKDLEEWLFSFLLDHAKPPAEKNSALVYNESVALYAKFCLQKLPQICRFGASGRLPSIAELEQLSQSVFVPGCFGRHVRELLAEQADAYPTLKVPLVLVQIVENLRRLDCFHEEGIFRIPGDHDRVIELRLQLDRGVSTLDQLRPPEIHTLASLLKLWLQYIPHPLFPNFNDVVQASTDRAKAAKIVAGLPPINSDIFLYIVDFLRQFLLPEHVAATKMNLANLSICFAAVLFHCDSSDVNIFVKSSAAQAQFLQLILQQD